MFPNWQLSRYHAPTSLELYIDNAIKTMCATISDPIRNTRFEYWLLDPEGQIGTFFLSIMLAALIWLIVLQYVSRRTVTVRHRPPVRRPYLLRPGLLAAARRANERDGLPEKLEEFAASWHKDDEAGKKKASKEPNNRDGIVVDDEDDVDDTCSTDSRDSLAPIRAHQALSATIVPQGDHVAPNSESTSTMSRPAPLGHRPVNVNLNISPYRVVNHFVAPTSFSTPGASALQDGQGSSEPKSDDSVSAYSQGQNFSSLAKDAPVSYETLRERGWLDEAGTPSKKWINEKRLKELLK